MFPRAIAGEIDADDGPLRRRRSRSGTACPWFSPVWRRTPGITFLHHVHGPMWDQILPGPLASFGRALEARLAPPFYRRGLTVTPSDATREELLELGFHADRVTAIPNGTDPMFSPGGHKTANPSIVAVGRLAPVKRFELLIDAAVTARRAVPGLTLTIVGEGPEGERAARSGGPTRRRRLDPLRRAGRPRRSRRAVPERMDRGQRLAGGGLGLSLTEGAGCGTPAVATDIRGHRSSVVDGVTGMLAAPDQLGDELARVLLDDALRLRLGQAALERARTLTWDASALGIIRVLHRAVTVTVGNDSRQ